MNLPSGAGGVMADFPGKRFEICNWVGVFYVSMREEAQAGGRRPQH